MLLLDCTLNTPEENLALDEALLDEAEAAVAAGRQSHDVLRVWEPAEPLVVMGRSTHASREVNLAACRERGIPILRRHSGGASIVAGPGCLMYAAVLGYERWPAVRSVDHAHEYVLGKVLAAVRTRVPDAMRLGTSDLAVGDRKFSGNSLRCVREHVLYHGTLLYDFPLELIAECLTQPPRQPEYRAGRSHSEFVMNLPMSGNELREALVRAWKVEGLLENWPRERVRVLAESKYANGEWIRAEK